MVSRTAEYAMRAVVALACHEKDDFVPASTLSRETGIPKNYVSTILHALGRANITVGLRGPGGGFRLARAAKRVTALEVVTLFDDLDSQSRCLLGLHSCCPENPCSAHGRWIKVWNSYERFLRQTTLDRAISPLIRQAVGGSAPEGLRSPRSPRRH
jgi:Rrf2 family protein